MYTPLFRAFWRKQSLVVFFHFKILSTRLAATINAIFRMHLIFPRPGGGTIAAGNRDSPPGRVRPTAGACWHWECLRVSFPHAPFPRSRSGFCSILFFSRRIPSWIPPFPSLVGRFLVTFLAPFGPLLAFFASLFFLCVFWSVFLRFVDSFLANFKC